MITYAVCGKDDYTMVAMTTNADRDIHFVLQMNF